MVNCLSSQIVRMHCTVVQVQVDTVQIAVQVGSISGLIVESGVSEGFTNLRISDEFQPGTASFLRR